MFTLAIEDVLQSLQLDHAVTRQGLPPLQRVAARQQHGQQRACRPPPSRWLVPREPGQGQLPQQGQGAGAGGELAGLGSLPPELIRHIVDLSAYPLSAWAAASSQ